MSDPSPQPSPQVLYLDVTPKHVYGRTLYEPANDRARSLARLLGCKTFTRYQLEGFRLLGFVPLDVSQPDSLLVGQVAP